MGIRRLIEKVAAARGSGKASADPRPGHAEAEEPARLREAMVRHQIEARGVRDPRVLAALGSVPRHRFVPPECRHLAYRDGPLCIGHRQTISQPYIVALMTELIRPRPGMRVLEIGTGSGYQVAVLAECVGEVYTVEIVPELARAAARRLAELGYGGVHTRVGDGSDGWVEEAPFDAILVTAAAPRVPPPLVAQLAAGGTMVVPVGDHHQELRVVTRTAAGHSSRFVTPVRFVPMTGRAAEDAG